MSLTRAPGGKDDGLKGSSTNFPFWPGGFEEEKEILEAANKIEELQVNETEASLFEKLFDKGGFCKFTAIYIWILDCLLFVYIDLLWVPPGFQEGLTITPKNKSSTSELIDNDIFKVCELAFNLLQVFIVLNFPFAILNRRNEKD